jgi:hypothetical protein
MDQSQFTSTGIEDWRQQDLKKSANTNESINRIRDFEITNESVHPDVSVPITTILTCQ